MQNGRYIVIDGIDSCGKTTLIERLKKEHPDWIFVREPGDMLFSTNQSIRKLLLHGEDLSDLAEAYLFAADRSILLEYVDSQIKEGKTVVSDRSFISSLAYQSQKSLTFNQILRINREAILKCIPTQVFILDIDIETYKKRSEDKLKDRIEEKDLDYFERVLMTYRLMKKMLDEHSYHVLSDRISYLDATQNVQTIYDHLLETINQEEPVK